MAGYSQQYTVGINADVSQAQGAINKLQASLQALQAKSLTLQVDDQQLSKASEAAQTLQHNLTAAMNVKTGTLDLSKLNAGLQAAGTSISQISSQLIMAGTEGQAAFSALSNTLASVQAPVKSLNKAFTSMGTTLINTVKWQAASGLIHGLMSSVSGAVSYVKNLNSTLNDIQIVTGASSDQMARFAKEANVAAKSLSTTTGDFAKASLIYYQQGDNAKLAAEKAAITTKAANVAFTASAQEMSQMLTAVWNSYQMGEDQLEHAVDVMAKLGATTATSTEEIATGMQKVAATANTVGVSMEQMSAMIATSSSVTRQSAEAVGTSWNTILARLTNLKLGETLEDGVDLSKYTKALSSIGVQALDTTGNLREAGVLIDEIGGKWNTMNEAQKAAFAQTVGGVRQYTQIMAFFENFDKYQKNLKTANNADGELNKQQEIYAQSWEAATKRSKAAMEGLYSSLIDDKAMTQLTDLFTMLINGFTALTDSFGGAGNAISLLLSQIVSANIDTFATRLTEIGTNIKTLFGGDAEINQYAQNLAKMKEQMSIARDTEGVDKAYQTQLDYDMQILDIKQKIATEQSHMTQQQKEQAQLQIEQLQADKSFYTQQISRLEQQQKTAETARANAVQTMKENMAVNGVFGGNRTAYNDASYKDKLAAQETSSSSIGVENALLEHSIGMLGMNPTDDQVKDAVTAGTEQYQHLIDLGIQLGVISNRAEGMNVDNLVESLREAARQAQILQTMLNQGNTKMTTEDDKKWHMDGTQESYDTAKSWAKTASESSFPEVKRAGAAALQALGDSFDPANIDAANEALEKLHQNLQQTTQSSTGATAAVNDLKQGIVDTGAAAPEAADAIEQSGRAMATNLEQTQEAAQQALDKTKQSFKETMEGASKGVTTALKGAMTLQRVVNSFNSINNFVNKIKEGASVTEVFAAGVSTLVTVLMAANSAMQLVNQSTKLKNALELASAASANVYADATIAATGTTIGFGTALKATTAAIGTFFTSLGPVAWAVIGITALATVAAGFAAAMKDAETPAQKVAKESERINNAQESIKTNMTTLQSDLSSLSSIMNDTTMSYREQIDAINEIASAYGVQASAVEVLSGNYGRLNKDITAAMIAKAKLQAESAESLVRDAEANTEAAGFRGKKYVASKDNPVFVSTTGIGGAIVGEDAKQFAQRLSEGAMLDGYRQLKDDEFYRGDPILYRTNEFSDVIYSNTQSLEDYRNSAASLLRDDAWIQNGYKIVDEHTNGIFNKGLEAYKNYLSEEGELYLGSDSQYMKQIEALGFKWNEEIGALTEDQEKDEWDHEGLYKLLTSGPFEKFATGDTYTASVLAQLDKFHIGDEVSSRRILEEANMQTGLVKEAGLNLLGTNGFKASLKDLNQLIQDVISKEGYANTAENRAFVNSLLQGVASYDEANQQFEALQGLASSATTLRQEQLKQEQKSKADSETDQEQESKIDLEATQNRIEQDLIKQITDGKNEFTVEMLLRINPTDVVFDDEGNASVSDAAREYVEAQIKAEKAKEKQTKLEEKKKELTSTTIDRKTYQELQNAEIFDPDAPEQLDAFVSQSAGRRQALYQEMMLQATNDEIDALSDEIKASDTRLSDLRDSQNTFLKGFAEKYKKQYSDIITERTSDKEAFSLLYDELNDRKLLYEEAQTMIEEFEAVDLTGSPDQQKSAKEAYMKEHPNYRSWEEASAAYKDRKDQLGKLKTDYEDLQGVLEEGIQLESAMIDTETRLAEARKNKSAAEYWRDVSQKIENATANAEKFAGAIGKQGSMSADDLDWLDVMAKKSEDVLKNYQEMSTLEWNKYALEQAKKYYKELSELHKEDLGEQLEIQQQVQNAETTYYQDLKDRASNVASAMKEEWNKQLSAQDSVLSLIDSNLSNIDSLSFANLEKMRQDLVEAGIAGDRINELMSNLSDAQTDPEKIKAAMVIASEAALAKLTTLESQKMEYTGIVTELDTSLVDHTIIEVTGELENADEVESQLQPEGNVTLSVNTEEIESQIAAMQVNNDTGTVTLRLTNGELIETQIASMQVNNDTGTVTLTLDNGEEIESQISGLSVDNSSGKVTLALTNGEEIEQNIAGLQVNNTGEITLSLANGTEIEGDIQSLNTDTDGKITLTAKYGEDESATLQGDIESWILGENADGSYSIALKVAVGEDGTTTTLTSDIESAITAADEQSIHVKLASGDELDLSTQIRDQITGSDEALKIYGININPNVQIGNIQEQLQENEYSIDVKVKLNLQDALNQQALNTAMSRLDTSAEISKFQQLIQMSGQELQEALTATEIDTAFDTRGYAHGMSNIKYDDVEKAFLESMKNQILSMDKSELQEAFKDDGSIVNSIIEALCKGAKSGNVKTAEFAQYLLQGLAEGLNAEAAAFDFSLSLGDLTANILAAFQAALGIASPSKLTKSLAPYLLEGLAVGLGESVADFNIEAPVLDGIAEKIGQAFKSAIEQGIIQGVPSVEDLKALGIDTNLAETLAGIARAGGIEKWANEAYAKKYKASDIMAQLDKRLSYGDAVKYVAENLTADEKASDNYQALIHSVIDGVLDEDNLTDAWLSNYIQDQKWNDTDSGFTEFQKAVLNNALAKALNKNKFKDVKELAKASGKELQQVIDDWQLEINFEGAKLDNDISSVIANLQDTWMSGLNEIYQNETNIAQQTYDLWSQTFTAIAAARKGVLEGKSAMETLFGNPDQIASIITSYLNQGYAMSDIAKMLQNPKEQFNFMPWDAESYHNSGPQRFLNRDAQGNYTNTTEDQYRAKAREYIGRLGKTHLGDVLDKVLTPERIEQMQKSDNYNGLAALERLAEAGIVQRGADGKYSVVTNKDLMSAPMADAVKEALVEGLTLTQSEINTLLGTASATQLSKRYQQAEYARQEAETVATKMQTQQDLMLKAQQSYVKNGNFSSLNDDEKFELVEALQDLGYLGEDADLASVSLGMLQTAAANLAGVMSSCATDIGRAMKMVQEGTADNFTVDKNGKVTAYKQITAKEAGERAQQEYANSHPLATPTALQGAFDQAYNQFMADHDGQEAITIPVELGLDSVSDEALGEKLSTMKNSGEQQILTKMLQTYADAFGIIADSTDNYKALGDYLASLQEVEGTLGTATSYIQDWNSATDAQKLTMAAAAVEYEKASKAIKTLAESTDLFTKATQDIGNDTSKLSEKAGALRELAQAVNDYFVDGLVDSKFIQDNLKDIQEWAKGSTEAMERVEAKISDMVMAQKGINFDELGIDRGTFDSIGNGLKYGEAMGAEDLGHVQDMYNNLINAGKSHEEVRSILDAIADAQGYQLEWPEDMATNTGEAAENLSEAEQRARDLADATNAALQNTENTGDAADEAADKIEDAADNAEDMADNMEDAADNAEDMADTIKEAAEQIEITGDDVAAIGTNFRRVARNTDDVDKLMKDISKQGANINDQAADLVALTHGATDAFEGYENAATGTEGKIKAVRNALQAMAKESGGLQKGMEAYAAACKAAGKEITVAQAAVETLQQAGLDMSHVFDSSSQQDIELLAHLNVDDSELAQYDGMTLQAIVEMLADTGQLDGLNLDQIANVTYQVTPPELSWTTQTVTGTGSGSAGSSGSATISVSGDGIGSQTATVTMSEERSVASNLNAVIPVPGGGGGGAGGANTGGGKTAGGGAPTGATGTRPGGGGGCFTAGTLISTLIGYQKIENIHRGDIVLSYNELTKHTEYSVVLDTMIHYIFGLIYTLTIDNEQIEVTGIHRFFINRNHQLQWIMANKLQVNDLVLFADGTWHKIQSITTELKIVPVYNFEVSNNHNYFVGSQQILAHNKGGGGGGGGGGGREARRRDKVHKQDRDKERYHQMDRTLEAMENKLERIQKLKDMKYGNDYVNALKAENKQLEKQIQLQGKKAKEALAYSKKDIQALKDLANAGKTMEWIDSEGNFQSGRFSLGFEPTYDENGELNFDDYQDKLFKAYNQKIDWWNSQSADYHEEHSEEMDAWLDEWDKVMEQVEKYEEAVDRIREAFNEVLDYISQISANNLEEITYMVQLKVDDIEFAQQLDDYFKEKLKTGFNAFKTIPEQMRTTMDQMKRIWQEFDTEVGQTATEGMRGAEAKYRVYLEKVKPYLDLWQDEGVAPDKMAARLQQLLDQLALTGDDYIDESTFMEYLKEERDKFLTYLQDMLTKQQEIEEAYSDLLDQSEEKWSTYTKIMEHRVDLAETFLNMLELMGQETNYDYQNQIIDDQLRAYDTLIDRAKEMYQTKAEEVSYFYEKCGGDITKLSELEQRQYWEAVQAMNDAQDELLEYTESTLDKLRTKYENTIHKISEDFQRSLTGSYKVFSDLVDDYSWYTEEQERYLSTSKELYEISKLNRQINKAVNESANKVSKERFRALQEVINKQSELNELTEYDVKMMDLQYQLLLAMDDLENAKNAKNTVRLVRDQNGNMGYQYTADQDKIDEKQQKYEDVLQQINQTSAERAKELEGQYLDTIADYVTKREEIMLAFQDDEETRIQKLVELDAKYADKLQWISDQYGMATSHLMTNQEVIFDHYGEKNAQITEQINSDVQSMITTWGSLKTELKVSSDEMIAAMQAYRLAIDEVTGKTGTGLQGMQTTLGATNDEMMHASQAAQQLTSDLQDLYSGVHQQSEAWNELNAKIAEYRRKIEDLADRLRQLSEGGWLGLFHSGGINPDSPTLVITDPEPVQAPSDDYYEKEEDDGVIGHGHLNEGSTHDKSGRKIRGSRRGDEFDILEEGDKYTKVRFTSGANTGDVYWIKTKRIAYAAGGLADFTGPGWLDGTKDKPEYILNAADTAKMFNAIDQVATLDSNLVQNILNTLQMATTAMLSTFGGLTAGTVANMTNHELQQNVEIHAEFPAAENRDEISAAFDDLVNRAAQYANRR